MDSTAKLKRYQIMEPLGAGSQGHTFRAIDRQTNQEVAVKVLQLRNMDGWKSFDLFEREISVLQSLDHPGIPQYLDNYASEATGEYFLVMDLAPGRSLKDTVADQKTLGDDALRGLLEQMLEILSYLHSRVPPVIHRDIKPGNILLAPDGTVSLVDFGGVRVALQPDGGSTMIGTFGYMAPEQLHGDAIPATDIYGLGATIAALYVGADADKLPRDGLRIDLAQVMPFSELRDVLARMLEPDPADRLASAAEVRRALDGTSYEGPRGDGVGAPIDDDSSEELALDVTREVRELAKVPAPFSIVVWLWTIIMTGVLTIVQGVVLPIVYQVMSQQRTHRGRERRRRLRGRERRYRAIVSRHRDALAEVAQRTSPFRENPKRLPPGQDRSQGR